MKIETGMKRKSCAQTKVLPLRPAHVSKRSVNTLESLKDRLLGEQIAAVTDPELIQRLRRASDESASLAWATPYPLLALPELLAEKGREAWRQFERQRAIQSRGICASRLAA